MIVSYTWLTCLLTLGHADVRAVRARGRSRDSLLVPLVHGNASWLQQPGADPPPPGAPESSRPLADQLLVPPVSGADVQAEQPVVPVSMLEVQKAPLEDPFSALQAVHATISGTAAAVAGGAARCWEVVAARAEASLDLLSWRLRVFLASLLLASTALCAAGAAYRLGRKDSRADQALRGGSTCAEWWA